MTPCPHCDEKDERIAWLESELRAEVDATALWKVLAHLKRTHRQARPQTAAFMLELYRAHGRVVSIAAILEAAGGRDEADASTLNVWACYARKGQPVPLFETVWGRGYRMTPHGLAVIGKVLEGEG